MQWTRPLGEHSQGSIVAHRPSGFETLGHRIHYQAQILSGIAAGSLQGDGGLIGFATDWRAIARDSRRRGLRVVIEVVELNAIGAEPIGVWLTGRHFALEQIVAQDDAAPRVDRDHLTGTQAALLDDGRLIDINGSRFGTSDEDPLAGAEAGTVEVDQATVIEKGRLGP